MRSIFPNHAFEDVFLPIYKLGYCILACALHATDGPKNAEQPTWVVQTHYNSPIQFNSEVLFHFVLCPIRLGLLGLGASSALSALCATPPNKFPLKSKSWCNHACRNSRQGKKVSIRQAFKEMQKDLLSPHTDNGMTLAHAFADGHTASNTMDLLRPVKLSAAGSV